MYDVVGIEMPCIDLNLNMDEFPKVAQGNRINQYSWQGGGKVASGSVACARLGAKCAIMGCVGDDIFGRFIVGDFQRHGIDTSGMMVREGSTTSLSCVLSDLESGNRTFVFAPGTAPRFKFEELDLNLIQSAKYLFISNGGEETVKAVDAAREAGVQVFIDADSYSEDIIELIPKIDIFVASEYFYKRMYGNEDFEKNCREVMAKGPRIVIFTMGPKGCIGVSEEGFFNIPTFLELPVVDTVGAGDVFHGGFLAGLISGRSVAESARFANAVSSIKCTRIGGRAGIPDLKTVERFLEDGFIDYTEIDERVKHYERGLDNV
ncbi:MAG: carbohydrate kinase family protein [Oscillospiraceae bacterium]|nr:carbohydrate kinase family protein [Oscillospiraceae bacterium]